jgi:hypothetical protein
VSQFGLNRTGCMIACIPKAVYCRHFHPSSPERALI